MRSSSVGQSSLFSFRNIQASTCGVAFIFTTLLLAWAPFAAAGVRDQADKVRIDKLSDLTSHTYVIHGRPSDAVQNHEAVLALALQAERNLETDLERFDIQDHACLKKIYGSLFAAMILKKDYGEARRYLELNRGLQENQSGKLLTGLITAPYMQAVEKPGSDLHVTFRDLLAQRLAALPYEDAQGTLIAMKESLEATSKAQIIESIASGLDPVAKDGQISQEIADRLVSSAMNLEVILPVKDDVVASLERVIQSHKSSDSTAAVARPASQPAIGTIAAQLKGAYFGEALPGTTPVPFAPGVLTSLSSWVEATAFSPDGSLFFVSVGSADYSSAKLYYSRRVNDIWTPFAEAPFVADFTYSNEPVFSADGATLTFTGKKATGSIDLWTVQFKDGEWGKPVALPSPISSDGKDHRGSSMTDGTMFFCSNRSGMMQVYRAHEDASRTLVAELLGAPVNAQSYEGDPCIAPDGRFLVFYSARDGRSADLYVSFRDEQGRWDAPVNLGAGFNSSNDEYGAHLSSDGTVFFFTRHTPQGNTIYWVATSAIDKFKRQVGAR